MVSTVMYLDVPRGISQSSQLGNQEITKEDLEDTVITARGRKSVAANTPSKENKALTISLILGGVKETSYFSKSNQFLIFAQPKYIFIINNI